MKRESQVEVIIVCIKSLKATRQLERILLEDKVAIACGKASTFKVHEAGEDLSAGLEGGGEDDTWKDLKIHEATSMLLR